MWRTFMTCLAKRMMMTPMVLTKPLRTTDMTASEEVGVVLDLNWMAVMGRQLPVVTVRLGQSQSQSSE